MDTDSISVISVNDISGFGKTEESVDKTRILGSTSISNEEEIAEISQANKADTTQKDTQNVYNEYHMVMNMQERPNNKDKLTLKDACKSISILIGIIIVCIFFVVPLTTEIESSYSSIISLSTIF